MFRKLIYTVHRILGTLLSILFLMWFLSGIVMIYHRFPSASRDEKMGKLEALPDSLPSIAEILNRSQGKDSVKNLSLYTYLGQTYVEARTKQKTEKFLVDSLDKLPEINGDYIHRVAALWCDAPVSHIDTLNRLEQWIPFGRLKKDFPIYKFYFKDTDQTQLYVSSVTGEVLQCTILSERFWGWLGPIPHWVYFTWLRQDVDLWSDVIVWISIFGIIMLFAGFCLSIHTYRMSIKNGKGLTSPYKKKWYRWHHIFGTAFGIFLLTWIVSGMYSLADIPEWLGKTHKEYPARSVLSRGTLPLSEYRLDYRKLIAEYAGEVTQISWDSFYDYPIYQVLLKEKGLVYVDASSDQVVPFKLSEQQVREAISSIHSGEPIIVTELTEYDHYYIDTKGNLTLPVWKVSIGNKDNTCYYINPQNGSYRSVNNHSRWQFQLYQGFHSLRYKIFVGHPVIWTIVMWILLLGGAFVSLTGVVLGCKYLIRCAKRLKNKKDNMGS